ncbi:MULTISPECIES: VOC family protein [Methylobacterium]|mgnify:CR=1 FL=1|jgi:lactoylglutathione lyase|uniref:VOC family protein n=1 Tax=Methylobacterium TaxID=407 RepID=UPI0008F08B30|nr:MULTISPECIES: VOC family protein [Methylobacterium]MBZ6416890.1 VOC family protein [Methylobacterium sp.]MBK3396267.1 VOC family protein [Methylobacterium ajmalii]MBK3412751.1 VOC family protein [Methylobacterium ajmalii]MBK3421681.1 VOC family protein [Methylobacterium ajmalii]SFF84273.1 Catechol 2,3-dioxygenase [Methylobacterium sp. yr596]
MKLGYVILYVPDVAASVAFYGRAFGLAPRFVHDSGQYAELETGGTALAFAEEGFVGETCPGFRLNRRSEAPAGFEVGLVAEDVAAAFARAVAAGALPVAAPVTKPWGQTVAYVRDGDGVLVELCSAFGG